MSEDVQKVGFIDQHDASVVRIVHISDTHLLHEQLLSDQNIPDGDVLVHSGDFAKCSFPHHLPNEADYLAQIQGLNQFFASLPHPYKIFVSGNHETNFASNPIERTSKLLTSCIYLQDSWVTIKGIKFYGSPWNGLRLNSFARAFSVPYPDLPQYWKPIPDDTDVLVTHNPPYGILDLGSIIPPLDAAVYCDLCKEHHKEFQHFGCPLLKDELFRRIRPKAHLFGHAHEPNNVVWHDGILFSNAALACTPRATVINYYVEQEKQSITNTEPQYPKPVNATSITHVI